MERLLNLWRALVTVVVAILCAPLFVLGSPVLTFEWFTGRGPARWHWLRCEPRDRSW